MKVLALLLLALAPATAGRLAPATARWNAAAAPPTSSSLNNYDRLRGLFAAEAKERRAAARGLLERPDPGLVAGLVDALFFIPRDRREEAFAVLEGLSGERPGRRYQDWVALVGRRTDLAPREGYLAWKSELFSRIDPRYAQVLYPGAPMRLRLEEVVSGGVGLEGIPALDRPRSIPAAEARYLDDGERVFGVSLGGEQRAYPLRILDWHEMANDVVGGVPVALAYCTLCGAGVLYDARAGGRTLAFGSSGLLYESNKLMFDRETDTLWNQLTGEPVVGPLAGRGISLRRLPIVVTTWSRWLAAHPDTRVLDIATGYARDYTPGRPYGEYFASPGTMFPVVRRSRALPAKEWVFALLVDGAPKAYPLAALRRERVVDDTLAGRPLVLIAEPDDEGGGAGPGAVRAYERGAFRFAPAPGGGVIDGGGRPWRVTEDALRGPAGEALPRLPGHLAYWFGWFSFYPRTELYGGRP